ncbi:energy transducer TonB [Luteimonas deserti]|uniref:TonB family protein n=1 Tax=Luteimonas deserti TaxID=2752306 RepID=A0A7Z0TYQ9_9GAMM|nr:energy transducer TonB [Luteimonas deserti]NYZ62632.1 TonB family protein [Luteimonas deserti]
MPASADTRPDPVRVIGLTGTLAFNGVILMVLLVPASRDIAREALPDRGLDMRWITAPAVPPRPPEPLPALELPAPPAPRTASPPALRAPVDPAVASSVPADSAIPAEAVTPIGDEPATAAAWTPPDQTPLAGAALQYAHAPAPVYPRAALLAGAQGVVVLEVHVGVDGRPLDVRVHRSSGHRELDRAALRHVQRSWSFQPAMRDGQAVEAVGLVPISFDLARG